MATNIFVYWSDGLGDRAFDNHSRNVGWDIYQQKLHAVPGILPFFQVPGGCSRLELTRTYESVCVWDREGWGVEWEGGLKGSVLCLFLS